MRASWLTTILVVAAASEARAEYMLGSSAAEARQVSTIKIGAPSHFAKIERAALSLRVQRERVLAKLTLDVTADRHGVMDVKIPLDLPSGSKATGLAVTLGGWRTDAAPMAAVEASMLYKETVNQRIDPALLERHNGAYRLSVYPIAKGSAGRVDITVELPRTDVLAIEPDEHAIATLELAIAGVVTVTKNLRTPHRITLPAATITGNDDASPVHVDDNISLVAGVGRTLRVMSERRVGLYSYRGPGDLDKTMIRKRVKLAMPRFTYCYERELFRDPDIAGTATLSFVINGAGSVIAASVDGTLNDEAVCACLTRVVQSLEFPTTNNSGVVKVNYPLTFRRVGD